MKLVVLLKSISGLIKLMDTPQIVSCCLYIVAFDLEICFVVPSALNSYFFSLFFALLFFDAALSLPFE